MQADVGAQDGRRLRLGNVTHPVRGVLHGTAALAAVAGLPQLVAVAPGGAPRNALVLYGSSLALLMATSALYHSVPWGPVWKRRLRRIDHLMISVFIAAAATPFAVLLLEGPGRVAVVSWQWLLAGIAATQKLVSPTVGMSFSITLQTIQGWSLLAVGMPAAEQLPPNAWGSMLAAGALYTIGMILFIARRPRLRPAVFSYHEVFHLLVVVAAAIHFWVVARFLAPLGS